MKTASRLALLVAIALLLAADALAQTVSAGEAEAQKCEERIASVQRDVLGRYETALQEMQATFQKAADLDGALAVRAERQRLTAEAALSEEQFAAEPRALRTLQETTVAKLRELTSQLVQETVPRLLEHKKALTVAGKLDEAVAVRTAIERLQNGYIPIVRPAASAVVTVETLTLAYAADRSRADKTYKGQRFVVRGTVGGYRQDPADARNFLVYLTGSGGSAWVQCAFSQANLRIREERQFNTTSLVIASKENEGVGVRIQRGQALEIRGTCEGLEEMVRFGKCDLAR